MKGKCVTAIAVLAVCATVIPATAAAENTVRLRAGVARLNYVSPDPSGDLKSDFNALLLGATVITESNWYVDLGSRTSMSAKWNTSELFGDVFPGIEDQDFDRKDYTLTVGKALGDGLSVFGGFQNGESELKIDLTPFGGIAEWIKQKTQGFFGGVGKGFSMGNGVLALSGAIGIMNAEISYSDGSPSDKSDSGSGVSLGVAYNYFFTKNIGITAELKHQSYKLKYTDFSGDERLTQLGVSVLGQF